MKPMVLMVMSLVLLAGYGVANSQVRTTSPPAHVTGITLMGGLWQNENRGGFYFQTDLLPEGLDYFIVRGGTELYIDRLLAILLSAKTMNKRVIVDYIVFHPENPDATEGDVVAIAIVE